MYICRECYQQMYVYVCNFVWKGAYCVDTKLHTKLITCMFHESGATKTFLLGVVLFLYHVNNNTPTINEVQVAVQYLAMNCDNRFFHVTL